MMIVPLVLMTDIKMQEGMVQMHLFQSMLTDLDFHLLKAHQSLYGQKNHLAVLQEIYRIKKEVEFKLKLKI
tara:strand:+ start:1234 stop:1446 length:213 start_codon:yes stop_codon:yes gene_type:complete